MLRALERVKRERPEGCKVMIAESRAFCPVHQDAQ